MKYARWSVCFFFHLFFGFALLSVPFNSFSLFILLMRARFTLIRSQIASIVNLVMCSLRADSSNAYAYWPPRATDMFEWLNMRVNQPKKMKMALEHTAYTEKKKHHHHHQATTTTTAISTHRRNNTRATCT